jgi:predicted Zn finger-like uncharacterized protein
MKVSCQACGAKYTIADDKVRGRKVKIRCKSCGAPIVVDAQSEAPPAPDSASAADASAAPASKPETWSVNLSDTDQRTMTTDEIVQGWASGVVTSDAFVWKEGMADWVAVLECEELSRHLSGAQGADPAATPFGPPTSGGPAVEPAKKGLPAARVSGGRARGGVDLFDAVGGGGGEDDVATSAPAFPGMAGTTPYDDGKLTGARNENSVLFSLDALKGGLTAEPAKKSAPPRSAPVATDPLVASPASVLGGGGNPLFSLSADQALLTAPAPPEPPPRPVETGERGPGPNKLLVYGGAAAAAVVLLGVGLLLGRSGKGEATKETIEEAPAASAEAEKKAEKDEKKAEKADEEKADERKADEKKADESKADASASSAPATSAAPAGDKKVATATTGKTSTGASTGTKKEEPAPAAGTAPFSVSAAQVALTQAASNAASCKKPGGPTGSGKVQVTFATSGRVTSATVTGPPFAGTAVGGCVAGVFRRAKVPAFSGNTVTVSKSFSVK